MSDELQWLKLRRDDIVDQHKMLDARLANQLESIDEKAEQERTRARSEHESALNNEALEAFNAAIDALEQRG